MTTRRERAAQQLVGILDSPFLRAILEPARLEVVRTLLVHGALDIGEIARHLPQDRSVISRHLQTLETANVVHSRREGRRRVYDLDGVAMLATFESILAQARPLVPLCCSPPQVIRRPACVAAASRARRAPRRSAPPPRDLELLSHDAEELVGPEGLRDEVVGSDALRADVFARGDYLGDRKRRYRSIEELVEAQGHEGTHSILDMHRVSEQPAPVLDLGALEQLLAASILGVATPAGIESPYGTVFRMADEEVAACFGTARPQRAAIDPDELEPPDIDTGTGRYTILYDGEAPSAWLFVGASGD